MATSGLLIEFFEIAVDAPLAEGDAPLRGKIGRNARARGNPIVQRYEARHLLLEPPHPPWKRIAQPLDDLEERQVHIREPATEDVRTSALAQHALEIAEDFRHAIPPEISGSAFRGAALLLVVEIGRDRMMGVVDLDHEVGNGERQLMDPQPVRLVARRKPKP